MSACCFRAELWQTVQCLTGIHSPIGMQYFLAECSTTFLSGYMHQSVLMGVLCRSTWFRKEGSDLDVRPGWISLFLSDQYGWLALAAPRTVGLLTCIGIDSFS